MFNDFTVAQLSVVVGILLIVIGYIIRLVVLVYKEKIGVLEKEKTQRLDRWIESTEKSLESIQKTLGSIQNTLVEYMTKQSVFEAKTTNDINNLYKLIRELEKR